MTGALPAESARRGVRERSEDAGRERCQMRSRDTNGGWRESRVSTVVSVEIYGTRGWGRPAGPRLPRPTHTRHVSVTAILFTVRTL